MGEILGNRIDDPESILANLLSTTGEVNKEEEAVFDLLFKFSGFPETFLKKNIEEHFLWRKHRLEKIIREDLRDLRRLPELSQVEMLAAIIPDRVGSPLSIQSLREDIEVSHPTIKRWLTYLESLFYFFKVLPYSKSISNSIKKEPKIYLYDWTEVEDEGNKFENVVACHLLKSCHYLSDIGKGDFNLCYLRNKQKKEVDFLLTKNGLPWFSVECKLSEQNLDTSYKTFQAKRSYPHFQIVKNCQQVRQIDEQVQVVPATLFLRNLI